MGGYITLLLSWTRKGYTEQARLGVGVGRPPLSQ
jgi:hypothetical protein